MQKTLTKRTAMETDLYSILGITRDATLADIKRAFRKAVKHHHPDKGGDAEQFRRVAHAYEILINPDKRKIYDDTGDSGLADSWDTMVSDNLSAVMFAAVEEGASDLIAYVTEVITESKKSMAESVARIGKKLARIKKGRDRLSRVDGATTDPVLSYIDQKMEELVRSSDKAATSIRLAEAMLVRLVEYKGEVLPNKEEKRSMFFTGSQFGKWEA